jgi:F-type H+-transporting ATPase subunit delta
MTSRAAAAPFARALFDVARHSDPVRIGQELQGFVGLVEAHPELLRVLINAAVPTSAKANVLREVFKLQPLSDPLARVLLLLAERDQLIILPEIAALYQERLLDLQGVVRAEVTTAEPLAPAHQQALEHGLAQATGRRVQMSARVDPAILGGLVTRIGSRVFDGSIAGHLDRVKQLATAGGAGRA